MTKRTAAAGAWLRLLLCVVARGGLAVLACFAMWAVAPDVLGWHTVVVMTGSMEPKVQPGDALVYQPMAAADLKPGQVIVVHDPTHPGHLLSHRLARRLSNGDLITKGDANQHADSTPVKPGAVLGVSRLSVPSIGLPWTWLHDGHQARAVGALALIVAAVAAAAADGTEGSNPVPKQPLARVSRPKAQPGRHRRPRSAMTLGVTRAARLSAYGLGCAIVLVASTSTVFSNFGVTAVNSANAFGAAASFCPGSQTLTATADTYVDQDNNVWNNNFGHATTLQLWGDSGKLRRVLVNFTLPTVPTGCTVTSATLTLTRSSSNVDGTLSVARAAAAWSETVVTWNNQPGTTGTAVTASSAGTVNFTVTSQVQAMYPSSAFGFVIRSQNEDSNTEQTYSSREGSGTKQKLTVVIS